MYVFVCVCVYRCIYIYIYAFYFFFLWRCSPKRDGQPYSVRLLWTSDRLVAETDNIHNRQISMPPIPTIPSCERPQTNAFHRAATGIGAYICMYIEVVVFLVSRFFHGTQLGKCRTRPILNCTLTSRFVNTANIVWREWQNAGGCTDVRSAGKHNNSNKVQDFDQSDSFSFS